MNEDIKELLNEVDVLKGQLSSLRPLPEEALKKIQIHALILHGIDRENAGKVSYRPSYDFR